MKNISSRKCYILSFIIPVVVMITVFAILGIYPFGGNTIMTGDTTYQLVDYLSYYKTILFGNNDFTYSLSKNLGGEMAGFAAYYLYSPLNLLTLPFPKEYLFVGIGLIIILAPGLASLSMCHALRHLKEDTTGSLIFSLCYGLSGYVIVYNELIYYYTNIILLPLIFLALRDLIVGNTKKGFLHIGYILLLAYAIINNYYTGYMICIFLVIYVIYYLLAIHEEGNRVEVFIRFAANSLIAACLSCVTLIPAVMSLAGEKDTFWIGMYLTFQPLDYFSKLYTGSFAGDFGAGMPNIYCGIIIPLLLVWMLMDKDISRRKRIWTGALLLFFWVDFCINTLNVFWHGLNQPIGFPYRQAFVVVFFCIITAYENTDLLQPRKRLALIVPTAALFLYSIYVVARRIESTNVISVAITVIIFMALILICFLPIKYRIALLGIITLADLGFNACYTLSRFYLTSVEEYQEPLAQIDDAMGRIKEMGGDDVYRMEKLFRRTNNDAMMLDYPGLTHFSSSEKRATINFMGKLGFRDNGNWAMYTGINTALADSILGVRYIASQFDGTGKPYVQAYADSEGDYYIYENELALPLVAAADKGIFKVEMGDNPFDNQEAIADAIAGGDAEVLHMQKAVRTDNPDGTVSFDLTVENEGIVYGFFTAPGIQDATMLLDGGEWNDYFGVYNWSTFDLMYRKPGEQIHLDIRSNTDEKLEVDEGYFAVLDADALERWSAKIKNNKCVLYKKTSSMYEGAYDTDGDTLFISMPMDKGWHLYIEGREYELNEACGHLMGAIVPSGRHDFMLRFVSPGKYAGTIISLLTVFFLIIYCVLIYIKPQDFVNKTKSKTKSK